MDNRMDEYTVSICIPSFNSARTIRKTLESIFRQTYKNIIEIILVDNASTDKTVEIARQFKDERFSIIVHEQNIGGEANFEMCFNIAKGDLTAIYHSDDIYEPQIVEKEVRFLQEHSDAGAVFTMRRMIDENDKDLGIAPLPEMFAGEHGWNTTYSFMDVFKQVIRNLNFLSCPSAMVRTDIYKNYIKRWDGVTWGVASDLAVWLKILERHNIGILPEALIRNRLSSFQWGARDRYLKVKRADLFTLIEYYMSKESVRKHIDSTDMEHLYFIEMTDNYSRAFKHLIIGNKSEAKILTKGALSFSLFKIAIISKPRKIATRSRISIWLSGIILFFISRLPLTLLMKRLLRFVRYKT
ncbi:MAG: glycosyltransferase [Clostridia bacterium]|nr:glycosyltransferase [Clostridia bacterium]